MTSKESILKGGKTGSLFIADNTGNSLIFERIHLDPAEKKHMPPKGQKAIDGR